MVNGIKKEKILKRTNRKQNFKKFVETGYSNLELFRKFCKNDEDLLIYTCITDKELQEYIDKIKKFKTEEEQIKYLVNNQPFMNETEERFNRCISSMAKYLKGYIEYNGFVMANAQGDSSDWGAEFWAKFCKICNFYRTRWFHTNTLSKKTSVVYNKMLYKEFIYITRLSISSERKHQAFKATQDFNNASIFKLSLDGKLESEDSENGKALGEVIRDEEHGDEAMFNQVQLNSILNKALSLCKEYPEANALYDQIKDFYDKQDIAGFDKKVIVLGKIFLYKAGLVSPKILTFIKMLSSTYKAKYQISPARVNTQIAQYKSKKPVKYAFQNKKKTTEMTWKELLIHKRGEL